MINFSLSDLRNICDGATFSLGYDANEAALSEIINVTMASKEIMQITARTQGRKLYKQVVNVYTQGDEALKIIGKCSCEKGRNCKHVISAALAYLDEQVFDEEDPEESERSGDELREWMDAFEKSFEAADDEGSGKSSLLLYELDFHKQTQEIEMSLFTARELKGGGYGKINRARPNTVFNIYRPPEYFRAGDGDNVSLFRSLSEGLKTTALLKGKLGALILEGAIKTGRCFWKRGHKKPLVLEGTKPLQLVWEEEASCSRLGFNLSEHEYLIDTDPLYCINIQTKEVSEVHSTLNPKQIALIKSAPVVHTEDLEAFSLEFSSRFGELELQLPECVELEELHDVSPRARLYLKGSRGSFKIDMAFVYGHIELKAFPFSPRYTSATHKSRVFRSEVAEEQLLGQLYEYGFKQLDSFLVAGHMSAWKALLDDADRLQEQGFELIQSSGFELNFHRVDEVKVKVEPSSHWFEVGMHVMIDGVELPLLPILSTLLQEGIDLHSQNECCVALDNGAYLSFPTEVLKPIIKTFYELLDTPNSEGFKLHKYEAQVLDNFTDSRFKIKDNSSLSTILQEMKSKPKYEKLKGLQAQLRPYQQEGVAWMQFMRRYGFGGILADDMGLGKTLQTLSHLLIEKESSRQEGANLIVAPTSLLGNWENEANKFTPGLRVGLYHGSRRKEILDNINDYDLIVTTYTLLSLDAEFLRRHRFYYLVLDEAQKIKNARSESTKAVKKIHAKYKLALSGTPMENHLGELHSIFDTIMPGFLGTQKSFKSLYQNPIEKEHDVNAQEGLNARIRPFMLRRTKDKVASELPPKTEIIRKVNFQKDQAALYETIRISMEKSVRESIKSLGLAKSHISILAALLKLRQVCCDPRLLKIEQAQEVEESAKLEMFLELVEELRDEGRRILVFSQFTTMLDIIEDALQARQVSFSKLTGATQNRQKQIDRFEAGETEIFLISLKAGGVGLNLTSADTVIHYDPWWNPAAEDQATDRAYRIGQDKPVFVYKLIVENSVEEKIIAMQGSKKELANAIYEGKEEGFSGVSEAEFLSLFT